MTIKHKDKCFKDPTYNYFHGSNHIPFVLDLSKSELLHLWSSENSFLFATLFLGEFTFNCLEFGILFPYNSSSHLKSVTQLIAFQGSRLRSSHSTQNTPTKPQYGQDTPCPHHSASGFSNLPMSSFSIHHYLELSHGTPKSSNVHVTPHMLQCGN